MSDERRYLIQRTNQAINSAREAIKNGDEHDSFEDLINEIEEFLLEKGHDIRLEERLQQLRELETNRHTRAANHWWSLLEKPMEETIFAQAFEHTSRALHHSSGRNNDAQNIKMQLVDKGLRKAGECLETGNVLGAYTYLEMVERLHPDHPTLGARKADWRRAVDQLLQHSPLRQELVEQILRKVNELVERRKLNSAWDKLQDALRVQSDHPELVRCKTHLEERRRVAEDKLQTASQLSKKDKLPEAREFLEEALRINDELRHARDELKRIQKVLTEENVRKLPRLEVISDPTCVLDKKYPIDSDLLRLGRSSEEHIQITEAGISRSHARIERTSSGNYLLTDISSNGTIINDRRVKNGSIQLSDGDIITVGKYLSISFRFVEPT